MTYAELVEKARETYESEDTPHVVKAWLLANIIYLADESEDEKIKREILELVSIAGNGNQFEEIKDWLEKQGKQPTNKIKTKFKVGDYVVSYNITPLVIWRIIGIDKDGYYNVHSIINLEYDEIYRVPAFILEKDYRLWTIADTKDGDVLATDNGNCPFIYRTKTIFGNPVAYCGVRSDGLFISESPENHQWCLKSEVIPATKEQRNLLFQKMKEAGYEWDTNKKELKKMEVANKEIDDAYLQGICDAKHEIEKQGKKLDPDKVIAWLVANICDFEYYVKLFKQDFGL